MSEDGNGYTQLAYASTAAFGDGRLEDPETQRNVMQIVRKSRRNNPEWGIVGVLHFGNGYFFQVLEGTEKAVSDVFDVISHDERHKNIRILRQQAIDELEFESWSMKFLTLDREIAQMVTGALRKPFNPYRMDAQTMDKLIKTLAERPDEE